MVSCMRILLPLCAAALVFFAGCASNPPPGPGPGPIIGSADLAVRPSDAGTNDIGIKPPPDLQGVPLCGAKVPAPGTVGCGLPNGSACDDQKPCTGLDTCNSGVCKGQASSFCTPCNSDADCCRGIGSIFCVGSGSTIEPTGTCDLTRHVCNQKGGSTYCDYRNCYNGVGCL